MIVAMLAATLLAAAPVTIVVKERTPCAPEDYGVRQESPGVYVREPVHRRERPVCFRQRKTMQEWTDLPERGGHYLRTLRELFD